MNASENTSQDGRKRRRWIVGLLIAVGGLAPLVFYWVFLGCVPTITPPEAKRMLSDESPQTVLVDVRTKDQFDRRHIQGAMNWPLRRVFEAENTVQFPDLLRGKKLLLLCDTGGASARATQHLDKLGVEAYNVRGGMVDWVHADLGTVGKDYECFQDALGRTEAFPFRNAPIYEQLALVVSGLGFKPVYTFLSFIVIILLWRSKAADLVALRWAMIFFFLGENACAANYWFHDETSYLFEYLHGFGMMLCFGFATYALIEGIDRRILLLSEPERKCAALPLCGRCIKYVEVPCGLHRVFLLVIPACIILAMMPLGADWQLASYNSDAFGTIYNYSHPIVYQIFELVYCPIVAIIMLSISLGILLWKRTDSLSAAKIAFAAGVGPMGFALFRMLVTGPYGQNLVWRNFWEECTELVFLIGVCYVLWLFRRTLFGKKHLPHQSNEA